jgi:hypothetical protein
MQPMLCFFNERNMAGSYDKVLCSFQQYVHIMYEMFLKP